jgi:hypothetical protein
MAPQATPSDKQAEVVLVGCGAPLRGMGWYHAVQMLNDDVPSAKLCHVVEPWFLGGGKLHTFVIDWKWLGLSSAIESCKYMLMYQHALCMHMEQVGNE